MSYLDFFIDIETLPDQRYGALAECLANVKPPGNYKKQESIDKWMIEHGVKVAAEEYAKTALKGISGEVLSIAWIFEDGEVESVLRVDDTTEAELLQKFANIVGDFLDGIDWDYRRRRLRWIGHNVIDFDMRFLFQRMIINGVRPNFIIPVDARHGGDSVYDTMKAWAGFRGFVSQDKLAKALGLPGKTDITGADVWPLYQEGKLREIRDYNEDDVRQVREIYRRLTWTTS